MLNALPTFSCRRWWGSFWLLLPFRLPHLPFSALTASGSVVPTLKIETRRSLVNVEELECTVAMSTVAPSADDESAQVFVVPAHGELHHMMQPRDGDLLGNQKSPPDRRADAAQTDSQLENGRCFGRVGVHLGAINTSFGHIRRPDSSPRFRAVSRKRIDVLSSTFAVIFRN